MLVSSFEIFDAVRAGAIEINHVWPGFHAKDDPGLAVIHNFPGASEIFCEDYLFNIAEEFCEQIVSKDYDSSKYRAFVEERYPLSSQLKKINQLFGQLEMEIDAEPVAESVESNLAIEPIKAPVSRVQPSFLGT